MWFAVRVSLKLWRLRAQALTVAAVMLCSVSLYAQGKRTNTGVGPAALQIHVVVVPILSSPSAQRHYEKENYVSYDVPVVKLQREVIVQESPLPPDSRVIFGSTASDDTLITSTIVYQ